VKKYIVLLLIVVSVLQFGASAFAKEKYIAPFGIAHTHWAYPFMEKLPSFGISAYWTEHSYKDARRFELVEAFSKALADLEKKGLIFLVQQDLSPKKLMSIATPLKLIKEKKVKRVVLDSLTIFEYAYFPEEVNYRREVFNFIGAMELFGVTLVCIAEKSVPNLDEIMYDPVDFLFDGLILMAKISKSASLEHVLTVVKMTGQDHEVNLYPYKIGKGGIEIFPGQLPFTLMEKGFSK